ncbi:hypothetical protein ElyMa_000403600 [Elysia marginata]|uniref:Uncharacterized protein n=1 Tax=Elysia marginata TaxID=1093978 RepID=A0AAV4FL17_9GAST|nr:hypothetical protein ElyMa_000403600 [Elysia marginata]
MVSRAEPRLHVVMTEGQLKQWAEHFLETTEHMPASEDSPDKPAADSSLPINCEKPSKLKIRKATTSLRNWKASCLDGIQADAIKADMEIYPC